MNVIRGLRIASVIWGARLALSWIATRPIGVVLTAGVSDDRFLFEPGALGLLEVLRLRYALLGAAGQSTLALVVLGYVALACLSAWATRTLAEDGAPQTPLARQLPRVGGLAFLVLGLALFLAFLAAVGLGAVVEGALQQASSLARDASLLVGGAAIALLVAAFGIIHDLARTELLLHDATLRSSLSSAFIVLRRSFWKIAGTRLALAVAALAVTGAAAGLVGLISVDRPGDGRVWGAVFTHQVAAWLLAGLHVAWLGALVRASKRRTS